MASSAFLFEPSAQDYARVVPIGPELTRRDELFEALAQGLEFPDHFGDNWDALTDCLNDLSWFEGDVLIQHVDVPLRRSKDQRVYLEILAEAQERWNETGERRFRVSFPERDQAEIVELFEAD